jgi:hypothetical protein
VLCERRRLWPDTLSFHDLDANQVGLAFVCEETDRLLNAPLQNGWPVRVTQVRLFGRGSGEDLGPPSPGWYPDPVDPSELRSWDGELWGDPQDTSGRGD